MLRHLYSAKNRLVASFGIDKQLDSHGWRPRMTMLEAEKVLSGHRPYTFLVRPSDMGRGFSFSFVQPNGYVKHDHFRLINPKYGIFRNGGADHVGPLSKVVRDMMKCLPGQGQPL